MSIGASVVPPLMLNDNCEEHLSTTDDDVYGLLRSLTSTQD
jgi:hypothetical protein